MNFKHAINLLNYIMPPAAAARHVLNPSGLIVPVKDGLEGPGSPAAGLPWFFQ